MLINRKPELLLHLDALSQELLVANSLTSTQNLTMIQTIAALKSLNKLEGDDLETQIGFKLSGSYLTRTNLEEQVFAEGVIHSSQTLEDKKRSLIERRKTRRLMASGLKSVGSNLSSSRFQSGQKTSKLEQGRDNQENSDANEKINAWSIHAENSTKIENSENQSKEKLKFGVSKSTNPNSNQENQIPENELLSGLKNGVKNSHHKSEFINESCLKNAFSVSNELLIGESCGDLKESMNFVKSTLPGKFFLS